MSRTTKDILVKGITVGQAKSVLLKWFHENKVKILINTSDYVYGRWGRGILSASKFFEVTLVPTEEGVLAKTEGWVTYIPPSFYPDARAYLPETEFSESTRAYGGIPRKEGMKAIKRLWNTLEALSENP